MNFQEDMIIFRREKKMPYLEINDCLGIKKAGLVKTPAGSFLQNKK